MKNWINKIIDFLLGTERDLGEIEDQHQAEYDRLKKEVKELGNVVFDNDTKAYCLKNKMLRLAEEIEYNKNVANSDTVDPDKKLH